VPTLRDWQIQFFQVGTVLFLSPLITGVIARGEAIVQMRRGPRLLQPYYDIAKLFCKETVLPGEAGPVFRAAPYVSFAGYATVPLLIPVLTAFPLPLGYMGDILGGGFHPRHGQLRRLSGRDRQRQPVRPAGVEPRS